MEHFERFGKAIETGIIRVDLPLLMGKVLGLLLLSPAPVYPGLQEAQGEGHPMTEERIRLS